MNHTCALIVDDEADIRELLSITLERMDIKALPACSIAEGKRILQQVGCHLCLVDMKLPDGNGIDLVHYIQKFHEHTPVAMLTAHGTMNSAISALKAGAFDFVSKPLDLGRLRQLIRVALRLQPLNTPPSQHALQLIGSSQVLHTMREHIVKMARSQAPVYISGESGSGKELAARLIHEKGGRRAGPFVPVNCGAIASELMESEFFGHKKGSFTGAYSDQVGLFQLAHQGTLFLDEIADLPTSMQVKLLRALQENKIRPVGSAKEIAVDVRILSASHKNIAKQVKEGLFRQDLFYRIHVLNLMVPPLRERGYDIVLLARHYLQQLIERYQTPVVEMTKATEEYLLGYSFPGNIRELANIMERAIVLCEHTTIQVDDLQLSLDNMD